MTPAQTMFHVVLPQGVKNAFPAIGNEFVVNIKDSSVLNAISVTELFFQSNKIAGSIFKFTDTFLVTALVYLVLTFTTTRILRAIEIRMHRPPSSYPTSQTVPEARIKPEGGGAVMEHIVEIKNLKKHFGELRVLDDINFHIDKGDVITVIGSSGSGKSTLLRCINLLEIPRRRRDPPPRQGYPQAGSSTSTSTAPRLAWSSSPSTSSTT